MSHELVFSYLKIVYHENYNSWELDDGGRVNTADRDTRFLRRDIRSKR